MIGGMGNNETEVNLGKAAIFLGVICVLGIFATASIGGALFAIIGVICGILAIACWILWDTQKKAKKRGR